MGVEMQEQQFAYGRRMSVCYLRDDIRRIITSKGKIMKCVKCYVSISGVKSKESYRDLRRIVVHLPALKKNVCW